MVGKMINSSSHRPQADSVKLRPNGRDIALAMSLSRQSQFSQGYVRCQIEGQIEVQSPWGRWSEAISRGGTGLAETTSPSRETEGGPRWTPLGAILASTLKGFRLKSFPRMQRSLGKVESPLLSSSNSSTFSSSSLSVRFWHNLSNSSAMALRKIIQPAKWRNE